MKKSILWLIFWTIGIMNANASEDEKLVEVMLFVVASTNEDLSTYEAAISVCKCALTKAKSSWTDTEFKEFSYQLLAHADEMQKAVAGSTTLTNISLPSRSKNLDANLKKLAPYIIECEEKFDTRVEF
jgi:hypothetical protein